MTYRGTIIRESLETPDVITPGIVRSTTVERVTSGHTTPWLNQWTLESVEVPDDQIETFTQQLAQSIDRRHASSWYADLKNDETHYIVFRDRVFRIERARPEQYTLAKTYGLQIGIPSHQLDFSTT